MQHGVTDPFFPCTIDYSTLPLEEALRDEKVVVVIHFTRQTRTDPDESRLLSIALPSLDGQETLEIWRSPRPLSAGVADGIRFLGNDAFLFAYLLVEETDYPSLDATCYDVYRRLLNLTREQGYPYLLRVWNYFPDINVEHDGLERYQAFCRGRHRALMEALADFEAALPAACAIGTRAPGFLVYCIAARGPGLPLENPYQISAFRYPRQYGPKSPSFSRSVLKDWGRGQSQLYISGTASIVGHATRHAGDLQAQLAETSNNLEVLLQQAGHRAGATLHPALFKIYLRHPQAVAPLQERIRERFGPVPAVFLHGDICRRDLLIEIEGIGIAGAF